MTIRNMAINELNMLRFGDGYMPGIPGAPDSIITNNLSRTRPQAETNSTIRETGRDMIDAVGGLRGDAAVTLGASSDTEVATVSINSNRLIASIPPQDTTIYVRQIAQTQRNDGNILDMEGRAVESGLHRFSIETGGRTHQFEINVTDSDNNENIQRLMASAINDSNVGVSASIIIYADDGTSSLQLESSEIGASNVFNIVDTDDGRLVQAVGANNTSQFATNAIFNINGGADRFSPSNEISLAAGVTATLQGVGQTTITFGRSTGDMVQSTTNLVNAINSALSNVNASDGRGSDRFLSDLRGLTNTFAPQLERVGISVSADGSLSINESRLNSAAQDGSLERLFEGNSGFGARVERIAINAVNTNHFSDRPAPENNTFDVFDVTG